MHRELKIGLAVGVLLVGIVAAFFFRRHDDPELEIQELENTAELDEDVAEQPGAPYLQRVEADEQGYAYKSDDERDDEEGYAYKSDDAGDDEEGYAYEGHEQDAYGHENRDGDDWDNNGWSVAGTDSDDGEPYDSSADDFLNDRDEELFHQFSANSGTPEPIRTTQNRFRELDDDVPEENRHWRNVDSSESSSGRSGYQEQRDDDERAERSPRPVGTTLTHTVQPGDTLSEISARYLGTSRRFQEIYNANRDVLNDPNRLPVGVTITIPGKRRNGFSAEETFRPTRSTRTGAGRARLLNNGETETRARFVPAGRDAPFLPARSSEQRDTHRRAPSRERDLHSRDRAEETGRSATDLPRRYTVRSGDTLEGVARRIYGSRKKAESIFRANRHQLRSPRDLRPGMKLTLP